MLKNYKIIIPKYIIPIIVIATTLNIFRVVYFGKFSFLYIFWNIILAFIPYIVSSFLLIYTNEEKINKFIFSLGLILWILFIPNAPYIITDFIHIGDARSIPLLFDILLIFSSSIIGLIFFFRSLFHIEQIINLKYSKKITSTIMGIIILLISFGIYLGRFLRFNSWDVFVNHISLFKNIWKIFSQSTNDMGVYFYTTLFFFFLFLSYKSYKYIIQNKAS